MKQRPAAVLLAVVLLFIAAASVSAEQLSCGTYRVEASLSCYVNAMGGIEFGAPLLTGAELSVMSDSSRSLTLYFTKSSVTIYGITCDTFIDASPSVGGDASDVPLGTVGYYDLSGELVTDGVSYTLSSDTAENSRGEAVRYVDSVTLPLEHDSDTYELSLYVNSNVMGTQFSSDTYPAVLTLKLDSAVAADGFEETAPTPSNSDVITDSVALPDSTTPVADETHSGLSIYHPESSVDNADVENAADSSDERDATYVAAFKKPLLVAALALGALLILTGSILTVSAGKDKK